MAMEFSPKTARIVDVNINRLTEALKVVEDVVRLGLEDRGVLRQVRALRTGLGRRLVPLRRQVLRFRGSESDPGRGDRFDRMRRKGLVDVLLANFKRAEEAARVLEEVLKVSAPDYAREMKGVRFALYDLEKVVFDRIDNKKLDRNF